MTICSEQGGYLQQSAAESMENRAARAGRAAEFSAALQGSAQDKGARATGGLQVLTSPLLAAAGVRHGFSTRSGGVSTAYGKIEGGKGELNLGFTSADARENVLENRTRLIREVYGEQRALVTMRQIHSALVQPAGRRDAVVPTLLEGDGMMTDERGLVLGIQTADCVPVLVADPARGAVAAFHAGWRGSLQRIVEQGVERLRVAFGSEPGDLVAAIGPAIGPCCYQVGEEVRQRFGSAFGYADELFGPARRAGEAGRARSSVLSCDSSQEATPGVFLDLQEANRRQLLEAGLSESAIDVLPLCTSCRTDLFFSYRAEPGETGRMLAVIGLG